MHSDVFETAAAHGLRCWAAARGLRWWTAAHGLRWWAAVLGGGAGRRYRVTVRGRRSSAARGFS